MAEKGIAIALAVAVASGIAIGVQSTLNNWAGRLLGAAHTGLLVNFAGGVAAAIVLSAVMLRGSAVQWQALRGPAGLAVLGAGILGVAIITGIVFSLPRIGVAAGLSALILGQMAIGMLVDSMGWGGGDPIPLSLPRAAGLILLLLGTWLMLPRR